MIAIAKKTCSRRYLAGAIALSAIFLLSAVGQAHASVLSTSTPVTTCGEIVSAGTYTLGSNVGSGGKCITITSNSAIVNGAGFTINGNVTGDGTTTSSGVPFNFTLKNVTVMGTTSSNAQLGNNGGTITISTSTITNVQAIGGDSNVGAGGSGGTITMTNVTSTLVQANGGNSPNNSGTGGQGGTITLNSSAVTTVQANGSYGLIGNSGGTIIITGSNLDITNTSISAAAGSGEIVEAINNGTLTLNYTTLNFASTTTLPALYDLVLNGPGNLPGDQGTFVGGVLGTAPGGTVSNISNCNFIETGTYYLGANLSGNCTIKLSGVVLNGQGHTLTGNMIGDSSPLGSPGGTAGYNFTLQNIIVTGTTSANATNAFSGGETGGSITVSSSTLATTTANVAAGGTAGTISFSGSTVSFIQVDGNTSGSVRSANGGSIIMTNGAINLASTTISAASSNGGTAGTLTLNYSTLNTTGASLPALSDLVLNGPGGIPGDLGPFAGGPITLAGGNITTIGQCNLLTAGTYTLGNNISGTCYIKADGITFNGQGHTITGSVVGDGTVSGKRGNNFTLQNITVTATTSSNGNGSIGSYGMPGGSITLSNSTSTGITANGGALGGSITITNGTINLASTTVSVTGSVNNGTLTLNYTTLNTGGAVLPALSDLVLNGPGNSPGDVGVFGGPTGLNGATLTLGGGTISNASQCSFILTSGLYTLTTDISGANCQIAADGVVIDGGGHTLSGNVTGHNFTLRNLNMVGQVAGGIGSNDHITLNNSTINLANITFATNSTLALTLDYTTLLNYASTTLPALSDLVLNGPGNSPGDVGAYGGGVITAPGGTITTASQCFLVFPGTYTVGSGFTGNCGIHASGVTLTGATTTINGNINGNGIFPGGSGYSFALNGVIASGTVSSNGAVNTNGTGGNGGSIAITDGTISMGSTSVSASGALGSSGNGTNGSLTLNYTTLLYISDLFPAVSDLVLNGPGGAPGDLGAFAGGYIAVLPGTITTPTQLTYLNLPGTYTLGNDITGSAGIYANGVVLDGGGHTLIGSVVASGDHYGHPSGYNLALQNITVTGTTTASGYSGVYSLNLTGQGNGGSITISSSTVATTTSNGSIADGSANAGAGGSIIINNSTAAFVQADGGVGFDCGFSCGTYPYDAGGNGGTITIDPSVTGAVEANGGNSPVSTAGNGGSITITNSTASPVGSTVTANGGNATSCGYGGSGGTVHLINSAYGAVTANPGSNNTSQGCNANNNAIFSSNYSSGSSGGSSGLVQIVGEYVPPTLQTVSPTLAQTPAVSPAPAANAAALAVSSAFGGSGSVAGLGGAVPNQLQSPVEPQGGGLAPLARAIGAAIGATVQAAARTADAVANTPASKAVQATGFLAGLLAAAALYANAGLAATSTAASGALLIPIKLWGLVLVGLGIKKRTRPWGTVYDSVTKQPIDPAFVTARDGSGKVVAESITDLDGRYGFLLPPGTYYLSARKTHYEFPSKKMSGKPSDELYRDLYFGEPVTVGPGEILDKNIPMDRKDFDWNEQAKKDRSLMSFHSKNERTWSVIGNYVYGIGLVISVVAAAFNPSIYNVAVLVAYVAVLAFLRFSLKNKKLGRVQYRDTHEPLSYAIFRVTTPDRKVILRSGVCDENGRYYCIVPKGEYLVDFEKKNEDGSYSRIYESPRISSSSGIINRDFVI